ncbi:MAG TPA: WD40 repeat domain-containing protein [Isosphaeraceae bacterium]|nr:WD40 repeat domain-containing protein [Isosphaeraceae bacterium]
MNVSIRRKWRWLALALLALGLVGTVWLSVRVPTLLRRSAGALGALQIVVEPLAFSRDGKTLLASGQQKPLLVLDTASGKILKQLELGLDTSVCAFAPDGRTFVYGGWVVASQPYATPDGPPITHLSPNVTIRDARDGRVLTTLADTAYPLGCQYSPDGATLVMILSRRNRGLTIKSWDTSSWTERSSLAIPGSDFHCVPALTPDARMFALTDVSGSSVVLRDVTTGAVRATLQSASDPAASGLYWLAISPEGGTLAAAHDDGSVLVWNLRTGRPMATLRDGPIGRPRVVNLVFSPDGRCLVAQYVGSPSGTRIPLPFGLNRILNGGPSQHTDHALVVWDVASGRRRGRIDGDVARSPSVAISPDSRTLATWNGHPGIVLWDLGE